MVDNLNDSGNIQGIDQVGGGGGTFVIYYDPKVFALSGAVSANWRAAGRSDLHRRQRLDCRHFVVDSRLRRRIHHSARFRQCGVYWRRNLGVLEFLGTANAPLGVSNIDLAADTAAGPPVSTLSDGTDDIGGAPYTLQPNPIDNTGDVQTITFGGTINAGTTFTLGYNGTPTGPIAYSNTAATLQSNIQTALDNNSAIGAGNTLVIANSPTSVTVTFQGTLGNASMQPLLTVSSQLTGTNASVNVVDSGFGYYGLPSNDAAFADPVDGSVQVTGTNPDGQQRRLQHHRAGCWNRSRLDRGHRADQPDRQ